MRPELAALVVHDLKNALGGLEARLEGLGAQTLPDTAEVRRAHRDCAELRRRMVAFLTLYGGDAALRAHCEDESPRDFLAGLQARAARPDGATPPRLAATCDTAPPFWFFDVRLVRLAMDAALHNAWRFARSEVSLDARCESGYLVLSVSDDGPGLGADGSAGGEPSTGLGTELCAAVARAHGTAERPGRVRLFDRPGGGARFELWLA